VVNVAKRRGISTIVGGLIFLVLMASAFSTFYIAFDVQKDTIHTQRDISNSIVEKTQEQFVISAGTDPNDNNRLGIQVKNQGPNPVEVANIWIVNNSGVNEPAKRYEINYEDVFVPPGYGAPILENTPLYLNPAYGTDYTVKVVSSLGSIKKSPVTVSGSTNLLAEMFAIPPDVRLGENVTVALRITNIGNTPLEDVEPEVIPPTVVPSSAVALSQFISPSPVSLEPTESTIFTWQYTLSDILPIGSKVSFTSFANGTDSATGFNYVSNTVSDKITVRDDGSSGTGTEIVLKDELFGRPELFMTVPNVFGMSDDTGFWGITVANPTNTTMTVSKVTINLLRANANDNIRILESPCAPLQISPTTGWSCPNQNILVWKNVASPQSIGPISSFTFLARVDPGQFSAGINALESVVVTVNTFSSLGSFGKGPYETSIRKANDAIVNVFFDANPGGALDNNDVQGSILGVLSGETRKYNVTMAELTSDSENVEAGSSLIINIPKDFEFLGIDSNTGFTIPFPYPVTFPDGSTQIKADLISPLDNDELYVQFTAKAPTVPTTKMYVMHILGTGSTDGSSPKLAIGPVSETVIQVCGTIDGCP
jgi:hypothetical protein